MKRTIRLTESELVKLVKKVINEQSVDLKLDGGGIKIGNYNFELKLQLPLGDQRKLEIKNLEKNDSGYNIEFKLPNDTNLKKFKLSDTDIDDIIKNNLNNYLPKLGDNQIQLIKK